ncbi:hypothetical protein [Comamonas antarctica]|uniref:hypothetical protein n=1 Tax=Comamonas antarctica TaxID=2743470 RepID=UPI0028F087EE|nr:hypothetical protein [Comamonas antarctica]
MVEAKLLLAIVNLAFGLLISGICFCRLVKLPPRTPLIRVAPHALMLAAGLVSGTQPWMGEWPTPSHVFCNAVFYVYLVGCGRRFTKA